jgi:hypothetical protein
MEWKIYESYFLTGVAGPSSKNVGMLCLPRPPLRYWEKSMMKTLGRSADRDIFCQLRSWRADLGALEKAVFILRASVIDLEHDDAGLKATRRVERT